MSENEINKRIALIQRASKKISQSDAAAKSLLMSLGLMTKGGRFRKTLEVPCITPSHR